MRILAALVFGALLAANAAAQMVLNSQIGNDPAKEKLCAARAKVHPVPFYIDMAHVNRIRQDTPDAVFIAQDGLSPQLIECSLRSETGRFEPDMMEPENRWWHLPKPKQFSPGINTDQGIRMAEDVCLKAAPAKIHRPNFDHILPRTVQEITFSSGKNFQPGIWVGGMKADRYDIAVEVRAFYKAPGPDLIGVTAECLLSPMLEIRSIQVK